VHGATGETSDGADGAAGGAAQQGVPREEPGKAGVHRLQAGKELVSQVLLDAISGA
jgi:hypothetical protein